MRAIYSWLWTLSIIGGIGLVTTGGSGLMSRHGNTGPQAVAASQPRAVRAPARTKKKKPTIVTRASRRKGERAKHISRSYAAAPKKSLHKTQIVASTHSESRGVESRAAREAEADQESAGHSMVVVPSRAPMTSSPGVGVAQAPAPAPAQVQAPASAPAPIQSWASFWSPVTSLLGGPPASAPSLASAKATTSAPTATVTAAPASPASATAPAAEPEGTYSIRVAPPAKPDHSSSQRLVPLALDGGNIAAPVTSAPSVSSSASSAPAPAPSGQMDVRTAPAPAVLASSPTKGALDGGHIAQGAPTGALDGGKIGAATLAANQPSAPVAPVLASLGLIPAAEPQPVSAPASAPAAATPAPTLAPAPTPAPAPAAAIAASVSDSPVCAGGESWEAVRYGLLLLDASQRGALSSVGNGQLLVTNAPVAINSRSPQALLASGNSLISALGFEIAGVPGTKTTSRARVAGEIRSGTSPNPDPLRALAEPDRGALVLRSSRPFSATAGEINLRPGVYQGGISLGGQAHATLEPGIYYLQGGGLSVTGKAGLKGDGVLIYNAPELTSDTVQLAGEGTVSLTPATVGPYEGVTIFQDRTAVVPLEIDGLGDLALSGTVYAAAGETRIGGNGQVTLGSQYIVDTLTVNGNGEYAIHWDPQLAPKTCSPSLTSGN